MVEKPETREELIEIFPEINYISDIDLRDKVADAFLNHAPDYFWSIPASSSGKYHQKDVVNDSGLIIHTKRTFTALSRLEDTYTKLGRVDEDEIDYARAAVLLHDIFKQGLPPASGNTEKNHCSVASDYLEKHTDLPDEVLRCIETHNGGWNAGDRPRNDLEMMHHLADMVGSGKHIYLGVLEPEQEIENKIIDEFPKKISER